MNSSNDSLPATAPTVALPPPSYPACFAGLALDDVNYRLRHGLATKADAAQLVDWWNRSGKRVTTATLTERAVTLAGREMVSPWICIS